MAVTGTLPKNRMVVAGMIRRRSAREYVRIPLFAEPKGICPQILDAVCGEDGFPHRDTAMNGIPVRPSFIVEDSMPRRLTQ